jgi:hypothetical protein
MSYGLEVYNSSGQLRLQITDRLTRLVYSNVVGATSTGTATVTGITDTNSVATAIPIDVASGQLYVMPHLVWITNNTVNWQAVPNADTAGCLNTHRSSSLILVFTYQ